jgi:hypothetical protein
MYFSKEDVDLKTCGENSILRGPYSMASKRPRRTKTGLIDLTTASLRTALELQKFESCRIQ